jgi:hypothetical protein
MMIRSTTFKAWLLSAALVAACGDDNGETGKGGSRGADGYGDDAGADRGGDGGAEARGPEGMPELGDQIDRMGRAAVSTALIATFETDTNAKGEAKDAYNAAEEDWSVFAEQMTPNLAILDALDGTCGNQLLAGSGEDRYAALAEALANDRLYVNSTSGTCGVYLGVEGEALGALESGDGGCGGRTPLDDVIERSYSVLAAGTLTGVDDTITEDDADHDIETFPWLAEPQD